MDLIVRPVGACQLATYQDIQPPLTRLHGILRIALQRFFCL